jgi:DNA-binding XRE family transcriptional regulator
MMTLNSNQAEQNLRLKAARVMRAVRKRAGLTQSDVAQRLETSQSAISKIEAANLAPPLLIWMSFCKDMGINAVETLETGYVDFAQTQVSQNREETGKFKVPSRYLTDCGTSVRWLMPTLKLYESRHGSEALEKFLSSTMKVDPDFFVILDHSINFQFVLDVSKHWAKSGDFKLEDFMSIGQLAAQPDLLGTLKPIFEQTRTSREKLIGLISNIDKYEVNFKYQIESQSENDLKISITPSEHLKRFDYLKTAVTHMCCEYRKTFLMALSARPGGETFKIHEQQCIYDGADRCIYEIESA